MEKVLKRFSSHAEQKAEVYRYWRSRPPEERFLAVWDATQSAHSLANSRKGLPPYDPTRRSAPTLTRVERTRS